MVKSDTILYLGLIGAGVYLISKSNLLGGVGEAVGGVGSAVGGVGEGVGFAGQSAGYNLADVFSAVGEVFRQGQTLVAGTGAGLRDVQGEVFNDAVPTIDYLGDIPKEVAKTGSAWAGSLGNVSSSVAGAFEDTWSLDSSTNIFSTAIGWLGGGVQDAYGWVKSQVSSKSKSLKEDISSSVITGSVVKSGSSNSSNSSVQTSGGMSVSGGNIVSSDRNKFLEQLGYTGTSTAEGILYSKPTTFTF